MKINELNIGKLVDITLVVMSATARETKAKKPYLQLELFDGTETISGNFWDWGGINIPDKNTILDVNAQVTEYLGTKQLNIKKISNNTTKHLSEFNPSSVYDIANIYKQAYECTLNVKDDFLRDLTLDVLEMFSSEWLSVPGAKAVHHAFIGGTLVHCLSVARIATAVSRLVPESNGDLCFVGGFLHDVGKLFTYRLDGIAIEMTDEGLLYEHTFMGAELVGKVALDHIRDDKDHQKAELLRHIILSHHGELEYGAAITPMCIEAHIVNHADGIDASTQQIIEQSRKSGNAKWTDRIYTLGNRPQLTTQYLKEVFLEKSLSVE